MTKREEEILNAVSGASQDREAALQMKAEYDQLLASARGEAQQIMTRAHRQGENIVQDAHQKAEQDANDIIARAHVEIQTEREQAYEQLKGEVVGLALAASEKLLGEKMDSETNKRLVQEYINSRGDD